MKNKKRESDLDKPTFWSYVLTFRGFNLYKEKNEEKYYTPQRGNVTEVIYWLLPVLLIVCLVLPRVLPGHDFWNYRVDLLTLFILLLPLIIMLDYKLTKFRRLDKSLLKKKQLKRGGRGRVAGIVFISLIPALFIFAFLNTFSFNWIRSQFDDRRDANLDALVVGEDIFRFDNSDNPGSLSIIDTYIDSGVVRVDIVSERTPQPIELLLNGNSYADMYSYNRRSLGSFWEETYFVQQYSYYLPAGDLEDENTIMIRCGDIEKEYTLLKEYPILDDRFKNAYTILVDGEILLRGHRFGDSVEQVTHDEGEAAKRIFLDNTNEDATIYAYKKRLFFGFDSEFHYIFEENTLNKMIVYADAFSTFDERTTEEKCDEIIAVFDVLGEPDVREESNFSDAFVAEWFEDDYYIFLYVHPVGFSFIVEQVGSDYEQ
ncbi:MAG: hypothetical protein HN389_02050 [Clostridia bacterium]|nr:hypothetical protein [Clostridia bacterium]